MNRRTFLFIHGYTGSGPGHWQRWLALRLAAQGETVCFPELPQPDAPVLDAWLSALRETMAQIADREVIVLAHSCGVMLWLQHAARKDSRVRAASRAVLVAPPSPQWSDPNVTDFALPSIGPQDLRSVAESTRLVTSDNDSYCTLDDATHYASCLSVPMDVIPGGGHLNTAAGYGPWPSLERWALTGHGPIQSSR